MSETPNEEVTWKDWTTVPELKETRLGALVVDLKELEMEAADLDKRIENLRALIQPLMEKVEGAVRVLDRQLWWTPAKPTRTLDRGLLVAAGVTPDQLKKGERAGTKKGFLTVRAVKTSS